MKYSRLETVLLELFRSFYWLLPLVTSMEWNKKSDLTDVWDTSSNISSLIFLFFFVFNFDPFTNIEWVIAISFLVVVASDVTVVCLCRLLYYLLLSTVLSWVPLGCSRNNNNILCSSSTSSSLFFLHHHLFSTIVMNDMSMNTTLLDFCLESQNLLLNPNHKRRNGNGTLLSHELFNHQF